MTTQPEETMSGRKGSWWTRVAMIFAGLLASIGGVSSAAQEKSPEKAPAAKTEPAAEMHTLPSGLRYQDLKVGTGAEAVKGKRVRVHYTGWLTNRKKFDSSVGRKPYEFRLGAGEVIRGWDEGVAGMKVGGKRMLTIPPKLGYGAAGAGEGIIPPNATLLFEIELLEVK